MSAFFCLFADSNDVIISLLLIRVGNAILDFSGLLIALATFIALCWMKSVMLSVMVSMSSSCCSISNPILNSSGNSIVFDPI